MVIMHLVLKAILGTSIELVVLDLISTIWADVGRVIQVMTFIRDNHTGVITSGTYKMVALDQLVAPTRIILENVCMIIMTHTGVGRAVTLGTLFRRPIVILRHTLRRVSSKFH